MHLCQSREGYILRFFSCMTMYAKASFAQGHVRTKRMQATALTNSSARCERRCSNHLERCKRRFAAGNCDKRSRASSFWRSNVSHSMAKARQKGAGVTHEHPTFATQTAATNPYLRHIGVGTSHALPWPRVRRACRNHADNATGTHARANPACLWGRRLPHPSGLPSARHRAVEAAA